MKLIQPADLRDCLYFTRRVVNKGHVKAWVLKTTCSKCSKGVIGKPKDKKTGKPKLRAKEYVCPECDYRVENKEYEKTLTANIIYTCPHCHHHSETQISFIRKKVKIKPEDTNGQPAKEKTVESLRFTCEQCGKNIDITKKMK